MEAEKGLLFVKIESSDDLRRAILGLSKCIIESLERYENFKNIRQERLDNVEKFKRDVKELHSLLSKLKAKLPDVKLKLSHSHIKELPKKADKQKAEPKREIRPEIKEFKRPEARPKRAEMEKLEAELKDIEAKLNSLI